MVSTKSLYTSQYDDYDYANVNYSPYYQASDSVADADKSAFYTFWTGMDLATAAKRRRDEAKKDPKKKRSVGGKKTGSESKARCKDKQKKQRKTKENEIPASHATASKEDLLAAFDRNDYLTVVTMLMSGMPLNDMLEDGTFLLSHAVDADNSALVSILAICGADPNVRHRSGSTPLHFASSTNCVASALVLLEIGAEVDVRDSNGLTPLHVACRERNLSIVLQLLTHGADPNAFDHAGLTPLSYALISHKKTIPSRDTLTVLLTYGARATGRGLLLPSFIQAILRYDSPLLSHCVEAHPEVVDAEMHVATTGRADNGIVRVRPLYAAILIDNIFAIDQLLRSGANVHHQTMLYGKTTTYLSLAVQANSVSIVSRLLLQGADPNVANNHGRTPLHLAAASWRGALEVVKLLLRHGANPMAATNDCHSTALHMAVRVGRADICDLLLKKGAPIDRPLRSGVTPFMLAVYHNNRMMVRFLMSRGADVQHATPIYGETAMHTASRVGNITLAAILLGEGLSVNARVPFPLLQQTQPLPVAAASLSTLPSDSQGDINSGANSNDTVDEEIEEDWLHHDAHGSSGSSSINNESSGAIVITATPTTDADSNVATPSTAETATLAPVSRSVCGYAPIHAAASRGHVEMVRWLLANGADPEARIGRVAADMCLGKDRLQGKGKDKAGGQKNVRQKTNSSSSNYGNENDIGNDDNDDESDPGMTPVEIARIFGHSGTAAVIEDYILAASPLVTDFLGPPPPAPTTTSSSSSSSSSSSTSSNPTASGPPPPPTPPPPPSLGTPGQPHRRSGYASTSERHPSQYSLESYNDSNDESEAVMDELYRPGAVTPVNSQNAAHGPGEQGAAQSSQSIAT